MSTSNRTIESEDDLKQKVAFLTARKEESIAALNQQDTAISEVKRQNTELQQRLDSLEHMLTARLDGMIERQHDIELSEAQVIKEDAELSQKKLDTLQGYELDINSLEYMDILAQNRQFKEDLEKLKQLNELETAKLNLIEKEDRIMQEQLQRDIEKKTLILQQREKEIEELKQNLSVSNSMNQSMKSKTQLAAPKDHHSMRVRTSSKNSVFSGGVNSWLESDEESEQTSMKDHPQAVDLTRSEKISRQNYTSKETTSVHEESSGRLGTEEARNHDGQSDHPSSKQIYPINNEQESYSGHNVTDNRKAPSPTKVKSGRKHLGDSKLEYYKGEAIAEDKREHAGDYNERYSSIKYYDDYHRKFKANMRRKFEDVEDEYFVKKDGDGQESKDDAEIEASKAKQDTKRRRKKKKNNFYDCNLDSSSEEPDKRGEPSANRGTYRPRGENRGSRGDSRRGGGRGARFGEGTDGGYRGRGAGSRR